MELLDLGADPATLVALVRCLKELDLLAVALGREQALCFATRVVGHHGVGGGQDVAGRAVVLFQPHHASVGVVLLEVQNVLDVGATPRVNGLVVVAHDHEIAVLAGKQVGDGVLDMVGVLVLVDADLLEAILVAFEHLGVLGEKLQRLEQQVVEVHGVGAGQATVKLAIDAGAGAVGRVGGAGHLVGAHHGVFGRRDLGADRVDGKLLGVDGKVTHDGLNQAF